MRLNFYLLISTFLLTLISSNLSAQYCATEALHQKLMKEDEAYRNRYIASKRNIQRIIDKNNDINTREVKDVLYTIPVVVHVINPGLPIGTGSNITDFEILAGLKGLNDRYSNKIGSGLDVEVQFCLATTDPDGCPTSGIIRVDGTVFPKYAKNGVAYSDTLGVPDKDLKDLSKWPVDQYYNIWVVNEISPGGIAGYAYYPNGNPYDGTIILASSFKYSDLTLAHELGHGLSLRHTFDGADGDICPDNTDCKFDGDLICDTPPHRQNDCGDVNPCGLYPDWVNSKFNYMSYCFPSEFFGRFTPNQKARVRATLLDDIRNPLLHSNGCNKSDFNTAVSKINAKCPGDCNGSISLDPNCPSDYTFKWNTGDTTKNIYNLCPGMYTVTITNGIKLTTIIPVEVNENPLPVVDAGNNAIINPGGSVKIGGTPTAKGKSPFKYDWSPATGLNSNSLPNPLAAPDVTTKYHLQVTDVNGCMSFDSVLVEIKATLTNEEYFASHLKVYPNPSKDNINIDMTNIVNGDYTLKLKNVMGQEVYNIPVSVTNNILHKEISLSVLPTALYLLEIANESMSFTTKVQKTD